MFNSLTPIRIVVFQLLSCVRLFANAQTAACPAPLLSTFSQNLSKFMFVESVMLSISFSAAPFSFCFQPYPTSGSFPMSQLFTSGDQSAGASASASVLPMNIQG